MKKFTQHLIIALSAIMLITSCNSSKDGIALFKKKAKYQAHFQAPKQKVYNKSEVKIDASQAEETAVQAESKELYASADKTENAPTINASAPVASAEEAVVAEEAVSKKELKKRIKTAIKKYKKAKNGKFNPAADGGWDTWSILGFIMALIGLAVAPILFGLLAIIFSAIGLGKTKGGAKRGKGFAIAGLILGIIEVLILFLVLVLILAII